MDMPVSFGTDGIRGRAFEEITVDLAYRLGRAVAIVFSAPVFVGYDTRESSPKLAAAVLAGLSDGGATAVNLGYFTTPGVAVIAQQRGGVGIVVSASHNPYYDNGLKVLGIGGTKLDHATEEAVADALNAAAPAPLDSFEEPPIDQSAEHDYATHLRSMVPGDLSSLHIVIDCANGAASHVAYELFVTTGAQLTMLHNSPSGRNINEMCGSTHPEDLVAHVVELGADLGLAFDGDADRLISVDATGTVRDGDDLMTLFALDFASRDELGGGLVVTSMSNLGLHRALTENGVVIIETDVGDRNVLIALEDRSWPFGGEQSGHLIFRNLAPTGDGLLTGLLLSDLVVRRGPLAEQANAAWQRVPQALINIGHAAYDDVAVRQIFEELRLNYDVDHSDVRLLIRPSGTEPVVRVMIEALNAGFVDEFRSRLQIFISQ
ncbi:MAG: phosphoglucosamine mutase [Acidimicrobiales bacterium]